MRSLAFGHLIQSWECVVLAGGLEMGTHPIYSRYQTGNCKLQMGWTYPRYRKVKQPAQ